MSTPPLNRDQQIELMVNAAERHAAQTARWMGNAQIQAVLRSNANGGSDDTYEQSTKSLAKCA
ncbi:hypothetical protein [Paracoccus alkanivorans]|uniref:Uncharacterized protein n=1 Tax=Paracoccus alkanivorans TaxID=2116655 RepID=A0A3M0MDD9_9RHOB|nr:hypothetical protein [Paracoccus alkanivorans]RMC35355.1 hypothetical protein C9E81_08925 [Paracoccus alkanivorans]